LPDYESEGYSPPFQSPYAGLPVARHDPGPEDEDDPSRSVPSTATFATLFDHMENGFGSEFGDPMGSESPASRHDSAVDGILYAGLLALSQSEDSEDGDESGFPGSEDVDRVLVDADYGFEQAGSVESDGWSPTSPWGDGSPGARSNSDGWSPVSPWGDGSQPPQTPTRSRSRSPPEPTTPDYRQNPQNTPTPSELDNIERILKDVAADKPEDHRDDPCVEIRRDRETLSDELERLRWDLDIASEDRDYHRERERALGIGARGDENQIRLLRWERDPSRQEVVRLEDENETLRDLHDARQDVLDVRDQQIRDLQEENVALRQLLDDSEDFDARLIHAQGQMDNLRGERDLARQELHDARFDVHYHEGRVAHWQQGFYRVLGERRDFRLRLEASRNENTALHDEANMYRNRANAWHEQYNVLAEVRNQENGRLQERVTALRRRNTDLQTAARGAARTFMPSPPPAPGTFTDFTAQGARGVQQAPLPVQQALPAAPAAAPQARPARPGRPGRMNTRAQAHARQRSEPPSLYSPDTERRRAARRAAVPPQAQRAPGNRARPSGVSKRGGKKARARK
jgi:hypothetical protein